MCMCIRRVWEPNVIKHNNILYRWMECSWWLESSSSSSMVGTAPSYSGTEQWREQRRSEWGMVAPSIFPFPSYFISKNILQLNLLKTWGSRMTKHTHIRVVHVGFSFSHTQNTHVDISTAMEEMYKLFVDIKHTETSMLQAIPDRSDMTILALCILPSSIPCKCTSE